MKDLKREERKAHAESSFGDLSIKEKILHVIEFPFKWMRKICIPPCEVEEYDNHLVIIWPYCGILVV